MAARERVKRIPHAAAGDVPNIASPLHLRGTPVVAAKGAPTLGQHTQAVLKEFGYSDAQLAELSAEGAFGKTAESARR
jgi:crotonobetainyl-CoA:carnitine CoA-transferase CaiB-like acyl-CoA transferase